MRSREGFCDLQLIVVKRKKWNHDSPGSTLLSTGKLAVGSTGELVEVGLASRRAGDRPGEYWEIMDSFFLFLISFFPLAKVLPFSGFLFCLYLFFPCQPCLYLLVNAFGQLM